MFNITDIEAGWLNLHIGNKKFQASYLTNVKEELDYLFNFESAFKNDNILVRRIYIDGEGDDLYLTAWKTYDKLTIIWEHADFDNPEYNIVVLYFDYNDFMKKYNEVWNNIMGDYNKNFKYDDLED